MIQIAWPWMFLLLPLPWLIARALPPAHPQGAALFLPFAASVDVNAPPTLGVLPRVRQLLFLLVWLALVTAAARPQWLGEPQAIPTTGRSLLLAVDTSDSMSTQDMANGASRLQVVQAVAGDFIRHRNGDRIGLILFGTRPYLQAPLTADLPTVSRFLNEAVVGIAGPATALGDAIGLSIKRLMEDRKNKPANAHDEQVLILLTDGSNTAGAMPPLEAAKLAAAVGLRIYTIGVGADVPADMFDPNNGTDLDEATLKSIASITGGAYFRAADADTLQQVYEKIDRLEPSAGQQQWYRPRDEWFYWPLGIALLLSVPAVWWRRYT